MKTKEQLEQEINKLNELLTQSIATRETISTQMSAAQLELVEINMPTMTEAVRDTIRQAVNSAVCGFNFTEPEDFDYDFEIDYDNRITFSNMEFNNIRDLEESICEYIEEQFKITKDEE